MSDPINLRQVERRAAIGLTEGRRDEILALVAFVRDARPVLEQAARLLRSWSGDRQRAAGKWTAEEQAAVNCACTLDAMLARVRDEEA